MLDTKEIEQTLYSVKVQEIWAFLKNESLLFWLINIYLFFEYVRPQTLYPALNFLPFCQIVIIATTVVFFLSNRFFVSNIENKLLVCFFLVIVSSSFFALSPSTSFGRIVDFMVWMLIYFLIVNIINTEKRFLVFMLAFLLYSFKMSQFAFKIWAGSGFSFLKDGAGTGPGWFHNSGEFGIQMCIFFPLAFYFFIGLNKYWSTWKKLFFLLLPITALSGMVSSSSRGAVLGGIAVLCWMLMKSKYVVRGTLCLLVVLCVIFLVLPEEQKNRFNTAGEDGTSIARLERWKKGITMAEMHPFLGVGFENWAVADKKYFDGSGKACHNIFVECMSELGYTGLVVFLFMILFTFVTNHQTRKRTLAFSTENRFIFYMAHGLDGALIGYLVSGFFVTVLYYPYFWINMAMTVALNNIARQKELL